MKTYKDFEKEYIGSSDIAALILAGYKEGEGIALKELHFGGDGDYYAYVVDEKIEMPLHYFLEATYSTWMKVYDDSGLVKEYKGDIINVYRAKEMGAIIHIINL